jgi:hypothetical protein
VPGGVRPIRVRSVLMYTIKILQRLLDRGTHNSIFAFVLLILKNHFQRAPLRQKSQATPVPRPEPRGPKQKTKAPRLPPPIAHPNPVLRHGRNSDQKGKLPETRLSKNTAPELCGRTFFHCAPASSTVAFRRTFIQLQATPDSRGALIKPQTAERCKQLFRKTRNFLVSSSRVKKPPPPPHGALR